MWSCQSLLPNAIRSQSALFEDCIILLATPSYTVPIPSHKAHLFFSTELSPLPTIPYQNKAIIPFVPPPPTNRPSPPPPPLSTPPLPFTSTSTSNHPSQTPSDTELSMCKTKIALYACSCRAHWHHISCTRAPHCELVTEEFHFSHPCLRHAEARNRDRRARCRQDPDAYTDIELLDLRTDGKKGSGWKG